MTSPDLSLTNNMPNNNNIIDIKPKGMRIEVTDVVFQTSSVTYNAGTVQYSQAGIQWGGSDVREGGKPKNIKIIDR